jgi:hypothetical protein
MRAVNLLPKDVSDGRKRPPLPVLAGCVGAVLVTALLRPMRPRRPARRSL